MNGRLLFVFFCLIVCSCKKDKTGFDYELINLPVDSKVRCVEAFGDSLLFAGGNVDGKGFVVLSDKSLTQFEVRTQTLHREIYDATLFNGRWFFGLDSVEIVTSANLQNFGTYYWKESDWVSDLSKHPLRRFSQVGDELIAVAGGKLAFGVVYHTPDNTANWNPAEYEHEMRALATFGAANQWTAWAGGDGLLVRKSTGQSDWEQIRLDDTFIAGLSFSSLTNGLLVTYQGEVRKTDDAGNTWKRTQKSNHFRAVNRMQVLGDKVVIAANDGAFAFSNNGGASVVWYQLTEEIDLLDIYLEREWMLLTAEGGQLVRIYFSDLK